MSEAFPLSGVPGVTLIDSRVLSRIPVRAFRFRFDWTADARTAAAVVDQIVGTRCLAFRDSRYPTPDPLGADIIAVRDGIAFLAKCGGNGWSSAWSPVSADELVAYLTLCIPFHVPGSGKTCSIHEPIDDALLMEPYNPSGRIIRAPWSSFRNAMASRLGRPTYVQTMLRRFTPAALVARVLKLWRRLTN